MRIGWSQELLSFQPIRLKALARSFEYFYWALFPSTLKSQDFAPSTSSPWTQERDGLPDFLMVLVQTVSPARIICPALGSAPLLLALPFSPTKVPV